MPRKACAKFQADAPGTLYFIFNSYAQGVGNNTSGFYNVIFEAAQANATKHIGCPVCGLRRGYVIQKIVFQVNRHLADVCAKRVVARLLQGVFTNLVFSTESANGTSRPYRE